MPNPWSKEEKVDEDASGTFQVPKHPSPAAESKETFSLDDERKKFKNHDLRSDIRLKRSYFSVTRKITRWWVKFIIAASALQFSARIFGKGLEAPEFIALITTTTATLVGFWAIVGAYLFPKRNNSD